MSNIPTRAELADQYLEQLPYEPYPVQEEALLAWFTSEQGVLVCAPTGTGKTLIAQAALFEALHTGKVAYYTTPLIALTEQKFQEMQEAAEAWGFDPDDVGLVTGNRRVNPDARVLIVVAEILLNRLLHPEGFDFENVAAVVMDEFHSFADIERGIVWELSLGMLPSHIHLLLLSATVGNGSEFLEWLRRCHNRKLELVQGTERKIPLTYHWVPDQLLGEHLVEMAKGDDEVRKTPALVFCFNRDACWSVAEHFKGLQLLSPEQKGPLNAAVDRLDWSEGVGPKLKQMLRRGVGVHHAGLLPKYRRVVEDLFVKKLLTVAICTETLAAGINLPARSVVLSSLVKGPYKKEKLIDASTAHQIFGRAGRPQFDTEGHVFALAHEDDVKILRWKDKYDQIPDNTKDPKLIKAKKQLKKKKPSRREGVMYWSEAQFNQLQAAPPGKLYSKGVIPWRLLAYLLTVSPEVEKLRVAVRKRLMDESRIRSGEKRLEQMLLTLHRGGFVVLDPEPPQPKEEEEKEDKPVLQTEEPEEEKPYAPILATPTPELDKLLLFRSIHPVYAAFLLDHLGIANREERIQAFESVLGMPGPLLRHVRVPWEDQLPPGPLATERLNPELTQRGLISATSEEEEEDEDGWRERPPTLAEKLGMFFEVTYPEVGDVEVQSVWAAGELLRFAGNFNLYVRGRDLVKQEGIIFRHLLRLILLLGEFMEATPKDTTPEEWQADLRELSEILTKSCREVDPTSTDEMIARAHAADIVEGEAPNEPEKVEEALE